ncbi:MAG: ribosome silencing factor [Firmicutes bacterium]|nr:ribosome silencing factor [Alicyclobacillaceae bacterium]MCL6496967.1 ribosome silencing factor [Bacillota bacterium]
MLNPGPPPAGARASFGSGAEKEGRATDDAKAAALLAASVLQSKKGHRVTVLDLRQVTLIADYFVIASGSTPLQVEALAEHVDEAMAKAGVALLQRNGRHRAHWVLLDYGAVVVHLFTDEERQYYNLERLWGDAEVVLAT